MELLSNKPNHDDMDTKPAHIELLNNKPKHNDMDTNQNTRPPPLRRALQRYAMLTGEKKKVLPRAFKPRNSEVPFFSYTTI